MRLMSIKERKGKTCAICGNPAKYETKYKGRQMFMCNMCMLYLAAETAALERWYEQEVK